MKKLLTILLVLLVAGFVFATADAKLTLTQELLQKTTHGFFDTEYDSFGSIFDAAGENAGGNGALSNSGTVSMDLAPGQGLNTLGYYSFATNSPVGIVIDLTGTPMELDATNKTYVPYEIVFTYVDGDKTYDHVTLDFGSQSVGVATTVKPDNATKTLVSNTVAGGTKWATYALTYAFNYSGNADYGLPSGVYTGEIKAAITTN
ncbi:MAG: hypothetical protein M0R38_13035 [Bacteroidia bacterium]|nr:hypothetical protein [Bacteroidia bacterium]